MELFWFVFIMEFIVLENQIEKTMFEFKSSLAMSSVNLK